ncbi:MAG: CcmB protein [Bacteroidetes bacterium ADurb.Bin397]|jgi:heme exporter protein B|nr:heme exporter protein CcmB [Bacteroidia bacterium]OQA11924.1 MAG: CcmB protein [Bacteroidetes bacterium ADurb.Bin397]
MISELWFLIQKEFRLEWRQKTMLTGMLIYVISTVFICYMTFKRIIDVPTWNALFWIIMIFAAINAVARSFMQESRGIQLYYYTMVHPAAVILSKIIYNSALLISVALIHLLFYSLFLGNEIQDMTMFLVGLLLGSTGLAATLTLVSAIASRASNSPSLMAILSFPILIPLLMTIIRFSRNAIDGIDWVMNASYVYVLLALIGMVVTLSYLLFPYLWKD